MSFFSGNCDEVWVKGTDDTWVTDSKTVLTLRADGTYTKQFQARVGPGIAAIGANVQNVHSGTYKRSGSMVHLSGDGRFSAYTENLNLFRKVSSVASKPTHLNRVERSSSPASSSSPPEGHSQTQTSASKWGVLAKLSETAPGIISKLTEAAPEIISFVQKERERAAEARDKTLAPEEPVLKQSHVSGFAQVIALLFGTTLTIDEEETLPALLKQFWKETGAEQKQALLRIAAHTNSLQQADRTKWQTEAVTMFDDLSQARESALLLQWLNAVRVRIHFLPNAASASSRRSELVGASTLYDNVTKLKSQIESAQAKRDRLSAEVDAAHQQVRLRRQLYEEKEKQVQQLLNPSGPASLEARVRRFFVGGRDQWRDVFISPHIPQRKLDSNSAIYKFPKWKRIIGLMDLTVFGSAKEAAVFCDDGVYFRTKEKPIHISYFKLKEYGFRQEPNGRIAAFSLTAPQEHYEILGSGKNSSLLTLLTGIRTLFQ
jgi:hypothetical protein